MNQDRDQARPQQQSQQQAQPRPPKQPQQPPAGLPYQVTAHPHHTDAPYLPTPDERTMAMLIHLLSLLTGFIGPLILWLVKKDSSAYINHHGKEAINFIITNTIVSVLMLFMVLITFGFGLIIYIPWTIMLFVFAILACVQAHKGIWYRIPLTIRLIK